MLRSRLVQHLGLGGVSSPDLLVRAGAAVDIIHAASLVHDDVIDGGIIRRGAPTFWNKHGTNGAILFLATSHDVSSALSLTESARTRLLKNSSI